MFNLLKLQAFSTDWFYTWRGNQVVLNFYLWLLNMVDGLTVRLVGIVRAVDVLVGLVGVAEIVGVVVVLQLNLPDVLYGE